MAAKKKTPAKKKPAFKKKPAQKPARKAASGKPSGKKSVGKKTASRSTSKTKGKGDKRAVRKSKRPSPRRKIAAKKPAKVAKAKVIIAEAPEALALARSIAHVAADKKAEHVLIVDVRAHSASVGYDYVVLASGESDRQLSAIQEGVDELLKPQGKRAAAVEASADWVCVTYDEGVIAHFFTPDRRELMDLEGLWKDAPRVSA
jgi:ribosome-associated protein